MCLPEAFQVKRFENEWIASVAMERIQISVEEEFEITVEVAALASKEGLHNGRLRQSTW